MDVMEKSIVQKLDTRVDEFAADNGAVVNTRPAVDKEHMNKEFTQVRVQTSKKSSFNNFCQDKSKNIIPVCLLFRNDFDTKTMKNYLTKMLHMMSLVKIAGTR